MQAHPKYMKMDFVRKHVNNYPKLPQFASLQVVAVLVGKNSTLQRTVGMLTVPLKIALNKDAEVIALLLLTLCGIIKA